ncbi:MAG: universal stress protein [Nitrospirae bacterium]|nr:universal stress protein [Nitrospirota bacterium]
MYRKILAAVNEHLNSEVSARYALKLAAACEAKLFLCFIAEKAQPSAVLDRAEEAMKRIFVEAEKAGVEVEALTESGDPVKRIGELTKKEGIDLVFASTRKADVERRFFTGTVARSLSLRLPCSVALVRVVHAGRIHPKNILVPLKARIDHVEERVYFTARISQAFGANVFLFHAPAPMSKFFHGEVHLTPLQWEEKLPKDISHFMGHMKRYKVIHTGGTVPGRTGKTIALEASAKRHDLIIMGASQRSMFSSIVKGNPVEELLRNSPCDLIIFRPRHENS